MRKDKRLAVEMRLKGSSYNEIYNALKVPKATLSDWFAHQDWSNDIRKKLTNEAYKIHAIRMRELGRIRGINLKKAYCKAREEATEEFEFLRFNPLFIAGLMLYWGEGDKATRHTVRLTNSDPDMLRVFRLFLTDVCKIPLGRIGGRVLIYPDLEAQECLVYWSKRSGLPLDRFTKCVTISGKHKTKRLLYGVADIYVCSTYFKEKIVVWLNLLAQRLMNQADYARMASTAGIV